MMVEVIIGLVLLIALGLHVSIAKKSAAYESGYQEGHSKGYDKGKAEGKTDGKQEQLRNLKLSVGHGVTSPSTTQLEKRVALAEMMKDSYQRDATAKHEYHQRQVKEYKNQITTLMAERDSLASQVQALQNPNKNPIIGSGNQGVMY